MRLQLKTLTHIYLSCQADCELCWVLVALVEVLASSIHIQIVQIL